MIFRSIPVWIYTIVQHELFTTLKLFIIFLIIYYLLEKIVFSLLLEFGVMSLTFKQHCASQQQISIGFESCWCKHI